jgi:hypothetical protein
VETTKVRSQAQRGQDNHRSEDSAVLRLYTVRARSNAFKGQAGCHQGFPNANVAKGPGGILRIGKLLQVTHSKVLPDGGPVEQDDKSVNSLEDWGTTAARGTGGLQQAQGGIDVSTNRSEPNREGRFILQTDASTGTESAAGGIGAVLLQEQKDKTERVVVYASRGLKDHEVNYPAFLLKKAAACWGIDYFDTYLTPPKQFTLCTDHRPLETMSTIHKKTLNNLQLLMLKFNFVIKKQGGMEEHGCGRTQQDARSCADMRNHEVRQEDCRGQ